MNNKYILLRHGETKYQAQKLDTLYSKKEQFSLPITKRGKEEIKKRAKELKKKNIDLIYCSDFYRTKQTAKIVSEELSLSVKFDKRLRDTDFGIFSGKSGEEYRNYFSSKIQRFSKRPINGESWKDVKKRAVDFLKEIDKKHKNKIILIISHADPVWLLAGYIKGLTKEQSLEQRNPKGIWPNVGQVIKP